MKKQGGWKFSWKLINGEAQITAGRMENFLKINKRVYPFIWDLRVHTGSFHKYDDDGLQQAVFIKKWLIFWPKQLNQVIFDTGFSAYYFRTNSFWYTDLQTLFFQQLLLAKIMQILVLPSFLKFCHYFWFWYTKKAYCISF